MISIGLLARAARALKRHWRPPPGPSPADGADGNSALVPAAAAERMKENIWPSLNHNPASVQTADDRLMFREFAEEVLSKGSGEVVMGRGYALGH